MLNLWSLAVGLVPWAAIYRVTGNLYITVITYPRINFGIALHSLYSINFSAEIILLYITLS